MLKALEPLAPKGFGFINIKRAIKENLLELYLNDTFSWSILFNPI